METANIRLQLTVQQGVTVLPRCLQILSRRGFIVTDVATAAHDEHAILTIATTGPVRWKTALPELLGKLQDVQSVTIHTGAPHV